MVVRLGITDIMAELKTKPNDASVADFLAAVADEEKRADCQQLVKLMQSVTRAKPKLWGSSLVGFGSYRCRYPSGRECDWFLAGFSPRKHSLSIYIMAGLERYNDLLARLGKHKTGKSCLYIKKLSDVDTSVLRDLITRSVNDLT